MRSRAFSFEVLRYARQVREPALGHLVDAVGVSDDADTGVPRALTAFVAPEAAAMHDEHRDRRAVAAAVPHLLDVDVGARGSDRAVVPAWG